MSDLSISVVEVTTESDQDEDEMCAECGREYADPEHTFFDEPLCDGCHHEAMREYNAACAEWRSMQGGR